MSEIKLITASQSLVFPVRDNIIDKIHLCSGGAVSTLEIFDGTIGTIATESVSVPGTGYEIGDTITLAQAGSGIQAVYEVKTVDTGGEVLTVDLISGGTGYTAGVEYETTTDSTAGDGAKITVSTVTNAGVSKGKISVPADESDDLCIDSVLHNGVSIVITGSDAKGYIFYS